MHALMDRRQQADWRAISLHLRQLTGLVFLACCPAVQDASAVSRGLLLRLRRRRGAGLLEEVRRQVRGRTHVHLRRCTTSSSSTLQTSMAGSTAGLGLCSAMMPRCFVRGT